MRKQNYGIQWAGYGTYLSFVIYEMANGKYKCFKNLHHNSEMYDDYKCTYGSPLVRERVLTRSAREGIDKVFDTYRDAREWARHSR